MEGNSEPLWPTKLCSGSLGTLFPWDSWPKPWNSLTPPSVSVLVSHSSSPPFSQPSQTPILWCIVVSDSTHKKNKLQSVVDTGLSNNTYFQILFSAPVVAIISGANMIVPRATLSKFIPTNEQGKVMSFLACLESISPLVAAPLYTMVYTSTFEVMPGAIFLLTAALTLVPILIFR